MIQEYRKASAEALNITIDKKKRRIRIDGIWLPETYWQPDKDANQMLMVWDWLKKQKNKYYNVATIVGRIVESYAYFDGDLFEGTMSRFMEYIKNKE